MIPEEERYPYFSIECGYIQFKDGRLQTTVIVLSMNNGDEGLKVARVKAQEILEGKVNHPLLIDGRIPNWIRIAEISEYHHPWPESDNEPD